MQEFLLIDKIESFGEVNKTVQWLVNTSQIKRIEPMNDIFYVMYLTDTSFYVQGSFEDLCVKLKPTLVLSLKE